MIADPGIAEEQSSNVCLIETGSCVCLLCTDGQHGVWEEGEVGGVGGRATGWTGRPCTGVDGALRLPHLPAEGRGAATQRPPHRVLADRRCLHRLRRLGDPTGLASRKVPTVPPVRTIL